MSAIIELYINHIFSEAIIPTIVICSLGLYLVYMIPNKKLEWTLVFLYVVIPTIINYQHNMGSVFAINFMAIFLSLFMVFLTKQMPLSPIAYAVLYFIGLDRRGGLIFYGNNMTFLVFLIMFLLIRRLSKEKISFMPMWITYMFMSLTYMFFYLYKGNVMNNYYNQLMVNYSVGKMEKILCLGLYMVLFMGILMIFRFVWKKVFQVHYKKLEAFGKNYKEIENYFMIGFCIIIFLLAVVESVPFLTRFKYDETSYYFIVNLFMFSILMIELFFVKMLVKTATLKERIQLQETEKKNLTLYNHGLEKNMNEIR